MKPVIVFFLAVAVRTAAAQEADSGFELRATVTAQEVLSNALSAPPRYGSIYAEGFRALLYPTLKLNQNWSFFGAVQVSSRPFFYEQLSTQGNGVRADILQAHMDYSRFWNNRSIVVRAGQLSSAFGSFLLRYDDAVNPLIDMPAAYGYYYKGVTTYGQAGAQVDVTLGKVDARLQLVNSSPANRRGIADSDQYGSWAGGAGYTIVQGLRVGVSGYRGPYLHRQYAYFFPGEAKPRDLPASALGADLQWGRGHWNTNAEWQWFHFPYRAIPTFSQHIGYAETRRVFHPRWSAAVRTSYVQPSMGISSRVHEAAISFRPNVHQIIKVGYQLAQGQLADNVHGGIFAVQLVTTFRPISLAKD